MVTQSKSEDRLKACLASDSEVLVIWWTLSAQFAIVWWKIASVQEPITSARPAEREELSEREKPALAAQNANNPPVTVNVVLSARESKNFAHVVKSADSHKKFVKGVASTVRRSPVPVNVQTVNFKKVSAGAVKIAKAILVSVQNPAAPATRDQNIARAARPAAVRPVSVVETVRNQTVESAAPGAC